MSKQKMTELVPVPNEGSWRSNRQPNASARGWRRSFRKRRANSDSDIPSITVENYVPHGVSDDSVIDIMSDSLSGRNIFINSDFSIGVTEQSRVFNFFSVEVNMVDVFSYPSLTIILISCMVLYFPTKNNSIHLFS